MPQTNIVVKSLRYTSTSGQAVNNSTTTTIIYGTQEYDNLGTYNSTTGVFTAASQGLYRVQYAAGIQSLTSANINSYIYKNGSIYAHKYWDMPTTVGVFFDMQIETRLAANDTLDFRINHNGASTSLSTGVGRNFMIITKISD